MNYWITWLCNCNEKPGFIFHVWLLLVEKVMATHSSALAWRIPWTEEPGGLPSMGLHRVGHDWSNLTAAVKWKWKSLSRVQLFATPWTIQSMEFSRILEWVAVPFSRGSSQPRNLTQVFCITVCSWQVLNLTLPSSPSALAMHKLMRSLRAPSMMPVRDSDQEAPHTG